MGIEVEAPLGPEPLLGGFDRTDRLHARSLAVDPVKIPVPLSAEAIELLVAARQSGDRHAELAHQPRLATVRIDLPQPAGRIGTEPELAIAGESESKIELIVEPHALAVEPEVSDALRASGGRIDAQQHLERVIRHSVEDPVGRERQPLDVVVDQAIVAHLPDQGALARREVDPIKPVEAHRISASRRGAELLGEIHIALVRRRRDRLRRRGRVGE